MSRHIHEQGPVLIRPPRGAGVDERPGAEPLSPDGVFLAACLWREKGVAAAGQAAYPSGRRARQRHHRLTLRVGLEWMAGFLDCVAEAARTAAGELDRLQRAEGKGQAPRPAWCSKLPAALEAILRAPIVTARRLAGEPGCDPARGSRPAAAVQRMPGIVREATGRGSWRAFVLV